MTDIIIKANEQSPLIKMLRDKVDTFTGKDRNKIGSVKENFPIVGKRLVRIDPNEQPGSQTADNFKMSFNIPNNFHISGMCVENIVTFASTVPALFTASSVCGSAMFSSMELKGSNGTIVRHTDATNFVAHRNQSEGRNLAESIVSATPTLVNNVGTFLTPFDVSFFDKVQSNISGAYTEKLTLEVTLKTNFTATSSIHYLWVSGWEMPRSSEDSLYESMGTANREILVNDYVEERYFATSANTSLTFVPKCRHPVNQISMFIGYESDSSVPLVTSASSNEITSVTFTIDGNPLYDAVPARIANWDSQRSGRDNNLRTHWSGSKIDGPSKDRTIYSMDFSLKNDTNISSGCVAMNFANNPEITVNYQMATGVDGYVVVVYRYNKLMSINPANGKIMKSQDF